MVLLPKNYTIYDLSGYPVCRTRTEIHSNTPICVEDFVWFIKEPKPGDVLHPAIGSEINLLRMSDRFD